MIDKILNELGPYFIKEQASLLYFVFAMILVMILHMVFARIRFIKYVPGIILLIISLMKLFINNGGHFLRTSPDDFRVSIICGSAGIISLCFARILGIMYYRKRKRKKRKRVVENQDSVK